MFENISSIEFFQKIKSDIGSCLFYFSHDECNVCTVLKPKIEKLINEKFPRIKMFFINSKKLPEISGQEGIFAIPTILIYFEGREYIRKNRNISISELNEEISRYYSMIY